MVSGLLQPLQLDELQVQVQSRLAGAVQQLTGRGHESGLVVHAVLAVAGADLGPADRLAE